jgi:hypothetical protein
MQDEGGSYAGDWCGGLQHGQGKECIPFGVTFVGEFRNNMWHGKGTGFDTDGRVIFHCMCVGVRALRR